MKALNRFLLLAGVALALGLTACVRSPAGPGGPDPDEDQTPGEADTFNIATLARPAAPSAPALVTFLPSL